MRGRLPAQLADFVGLHVLQVDVPASIRLDHEPPQDSLCRHRKYALPRLRPGLQVRVLRVQVLNADKVAVLDELPALLPCRWRHAELGRHCVPGENLLPSLLPTSWTE